MRSILLFFFFFPALVSAQTGALTIFSERAGSFTLYINGFQQNAQPAPAVRVEGMAAPYYDVKMLFSDGKVFNKKNVIVTDADNNLMDAVYRFKWDNEKGKLQFYSMAVPGKATPLSYAYKVKLTNDTSTLEKSKNIKLEGIAQIEKKVAGEPAPAPTTPVIIKKCNDWPMSSGEFEEVKIKLSGISNEERRLKASKDVLKNNCLLVSQVLQISSVLSTESAKFEFAKMAYPATIDRQNFEKVKESLSDPAHRKALDEISHRPR